MSNIDMTPELSDALRVRLSKEYGDLCAINFTLDILVQSMQAQMISMSEQNTALLQKIAKQEETIHQQYLDLGSRAAMMKEKHRKKE